MKNNLETLDLQKINASNHLDFEARASLEKLRTNSGRAALGEVFGNNVRNYLEVRYLHIPETGAGVYWLDSVSHTVGKRGATDNVPTQDIILDTPNMDSGTYDRSIFTPDTIVTIPEGGQDPRQAIRKLGPIGLTHLEWSEQASAPHVNFAFGGQEADLQGLASLKANLDHQVSAQPR